MRGEVHQADMVECTPFKFEKGAAGRIVRMKPAGLHGIGRQCGGEGFAE